jgi:hypothetical protein
MKIQLPGEIVMCVLGHFADEKRQYELIYVAIGRHDNNMGPPSIARFLAGYAGNVRYFYAKPSSLSNTHTYYSQFIEVLCAIQYCYFIIHVLL